MQAPGHLLYNDDSKAGYTRRKVRNKFVYLDEKNTPISNTTVICRLEQLGIPPAWENVWICKEENGYLQAAGYDSRQRKQYIYHPDWSTYRNLDKFEGLYHFGQDLHHIRQQIWQDIGLAHWPKEKVVALAIAVLDETYVRVGNKFYSETNNTYGLTTLRRKHLTVNTHYLKFSYIAKGGKSLNVTLSNKKLCKIIKACSELPGYEIFQYIDDNQKSVPITSQDINTYLQTLTGKSYSAKDFRTWGGSVSALEYLPQILTEPTKQRINLAVKYVSKVLQNTPAICKKYYIHPAVISAIEQDTTHAYLKRVKRMKKFPELDMYEKQLMLILKEHYQK
jgi:DNA topoisomerase-1